MHTLGEGIVVLLGQDRGRHQNCHLHTLLYGLECRTDRNLRLAVADISADQTVHNLSAFHVPFRVFDSRQLIVGLLVGEHFLKLFLPDCVLPVYMTLPGLALCVQFHKVIRDQLHCLLDPSAGIIPILGAEFVELWLAGALCRRVFLQDCQVCGHDKKYAACAVFDFEVISRDMVNFDLLDAPVNADPVVFVDHVIADAQLCEVPDLLPAVIAAGFFLFLLFLSENIRFRKNRKTQIRVGKAFAHSPGKGHDVSGFHGPLRAFAEIGHHIVRRQAFCQTFCPRPGRGDNDDALLFLSKL